MFINFVRFRSDSWLRRSEKAETFGFTERFASKINNIGPQRYKELASPGEGQWNVIGRAWTHLLLKTQQIYSCIWINSLRKGPENWVNRASTTKDLRTAQRQVEEAVIKSPQRKKKKKKPHLSHSSPKWERFQRNESFPWGLGYFSSTSDTPTPKSCIREMSFENQWKICPGKL